MKKKEKTIGYYTAKLATLTDARLKNLIQTSIEFAANAYAPYSKFHVSAVARLTNGEVIKGANMENASYPVCICAERNLLSTVVSNFPNEKIVDIAVYVDKDLGVPVPPCGLCRQTLVEVELRQKAPIRLSMVAKNGDIIIVDSCLDLLPWSFDGTYLD